ncbi:hypothetical protein [Streptomyces chryseus]|uniref:hypothetical protein n=1 Tax=Streptomyces chryseus TaxID=68186 RepID=UPI00110FAA13|nr:hypothetical protein [Streptomyces chryseus]
MAVQTFVVHQPDALPEVHSWYQAYQLERTRATIRELEQYEELERRRREAARVQSSWKIEPKRAGRPALPHRGACTAYQGHAGYLSELKAHCPGQPDIGPCRFTQCPCLRTRVLNGVINEYRYAA